MSFKRSDVLVESPESNRAIPRSCQPSSESDLILGHSNVPEAKTSEKGRVAREVIHLGVEMMPSVAEAYSSNPCAKEFVKIGFFLFVVQRQMDLTEAHHELPKRRWIIVNSPAVTTADKVRVVDHGNAVCATFDELSFEHGRFCRFLIERFTAFQNLA